MVTLWFGACCHFVSHLKREPETRLAEAAACTPQPIAQKNKSLEKQPPFSVWNEKYWHRILLMLAGARSTMKRFAEFVFSGAVSGV